MHANSTQRAGLMVKDRNHLSLISELVETHKIFR